jgi:hypothetical protein
METVEAFDKKTGLMGSPMALDSLENGYMSHRMWG